MKGRAPVAKAAPPLVKVSARIAVATQPDSIPVDVWQGSPNSPPGRSLGELMASSHRLAPTVTSTRSPGKCGAIGPSSSMQLDSYPSTWSSQSTSLLGGDEGRASETIPPSEILEPPRTPPAAPASSKIAVDSPFNAFRPFIAPSLSASTTAQAPPAAAPPSAAALSALPSLHPPSVPPATGPAPSPSDDVAAGVGNAHSGAAAGAPMRKMGAERGAEGAHSVTGVGAVAAAGSSLQ